MKIKEVIAAEAGQKIEAELDAQCDAELRAMTPERRLDAIAAMFSKEISQARAENETIKQALKDA